MSLILASSSPWRLEILRSQGFAVTGCAHTVDESAFAFGDDPEDGVRRLAEAKALSVSRSREARDLVVGADQVALIDGEVHGKVETAEAARVLLTRLQGRAHDLLCGWALARGPAVTASGVERVTLTMHALTADRICRYVATNEWQGTAGCYRYEAEGGALFAHVSGDDRAVMGLPVRSLLPALAREGVLPEA